MNRHINKLITFTRSIVLAANTHSLKGVRCASSYLSRTHTCGELDAGHTGQEVELCGWVQYQRMSQFITIRDRHGVTQVVLPDQNKDDSIPKESVVKVKGLVQKRPEGQANKKMATGDIEIRVTKIEILNACRGKLPFHIHDFHKVNENLRMEHRYLDIRNSTIQNNLRIRSKFVMKLREFLCNDHGFIDIETPTLFRRTPGGAKEFVVPTHLAGKFYSLPQSPQQFKQLLMAGGCDRYMQVARCYRDETAKPDRQPEFTQVDLEMSFVTQDGIKSLIEDMLVYSWPDHLEPIVAPFPRMSYADAMKYYGSDKPDTRFDVKLSDLTASMSGCTFEPFRKGTTSRESSIQAINFPSAGKMLSNKDIKALDKVCSDLQKGSETVWHAIIKIKEDKIWQGSLGENLGDAYQQIINEKLNINSGDILVLGSGTNTDVHTLVGRLRVEIANLLEGKGQTIREKGMNFLWVEDFPLFLPKEDGSPGCESAHHPFTAPYPEDEGLVYTTPEQARSQHYDLVLNGSEIGGGSIRIHNAELQRYILSEVLKEDSSTLEHLLRALELGCPPHGGIALGLDRLVAILCNTTSIKDVIAFPKSIEGRDVMSQAPATIEEKDLQYYHIRSTSC